MKPSDIRKQLAPYIIADKRATTIAHAFASALAPIEVYDEQRVRESLILLGQKDLVALTCVYCDAPAETWDHLEALVRDKAPSGFGHTLGNLVPACKPCNSARGNKPFESWMVGRGASSDRVAAVRAHQERFGGSDATASRVALTVEQSERLRSIQSQIIDLMNEADHILAAARAMTG